MRPSWDYYFMALCKLVASRSTCNSRPSGAIIVKDKRILCTGYNGALSGQPHCSDQTAVACPNCMGSGYKIDGTTTAKTIVCPTCLGSKLIPFCQRRVKGVPDAFKQLSCPSNHAEINAICQAASIGVSLKGAALFCTLEPCFPCLKAIGAVGIERVVFESYYDDDKDVTVEFGHFGSIRSIQQLHLPKETIEFFCSFLESGTSLRKNLPKTK